MNKNIALMALTGILTLSACGQNGNTPVTCDAGQQLVNGVCTTPVTQRTLTVTVNGIGTAVPVTVTRADGTVVGTYSVSNGQKLELAAGKYTVTPGMVTGYTNSGAQAVDLTNGNATATVTYTAAPGVQTAVLTIDLVGAATAPVTIKDATGAVVSGYNNAYVRDGETITLPRGQYTVLGGNTLTAVAPVDAKAADLRNGNATVTLNYATNEARTGAFYVNGEGQRVYFNADPAKLRADIAAGKFRFSSWLENRDGGITVGNNTVTGVPTDAERTEYAPINTQNIVGAYTEYNDNGVWRPVVNSEVQMEILEQRGNVRFAAADDQDRSTMAPLDITSNALSSRSWTNLSTDPNYIPYPNSATYPAYNRTGVAAPNTTGYTWAALNHDPKFATPGADGIAASARIRAIGFVNGIEIDKQFLNKNYVASAQIEVIKEVVVLDQRQRDIVVSSLGDANPTYEPGQEVGIRIRIVNRGQAAATNISLTEALQSGDTQNYAIGFSPALQTYAANQGFTNIVSTDDNFTATLPTLAAGETRDIVFVATGARDGTYCDTATINSYVNGIGQLSPAYVDSAAGNLNTTGNPAAGLAANVDATCFTVKGVPALSIVKELVDAQGRVIPDGTQVARNEAVNIRVTVRNGGSGVANGITVQDRLTTGTAASHSITLPPNANVTPVGDDGFNWNVGSLPAGGVAEYTFAARGSADGRYCDTVTLASTNVTPINTTDSACFNVATAQLEISKTNDPRVDLTGGDSYTSTIIVRNTGTLAAQNIVVRDLLGRLSTNQNVQVNFASGRYVLVVRDPATGELREETTPGGVVVDGAAPNATVRTLGRATPDTGITLNPGESIVLNVVSTIPAGTAPGQYCNVATVTAAPNVVFTNNRAEACVTVTPRVAIQTELFDSNDLIAPGEATAYTAIGFNENQSTESLVNNIFRFNVGVPEGRTGNGVFTTSNVNVYYDPTALDQNSGQVVFNLGGDTQNITGQARIEPNPATGQFTVTLPASFGIQPGGAVFVTFNGQAPATATPGSYNTLLEWTSNGQVSNAAKTGTSQEDTTVRRQ